MELGLLSVVGAGLLIGLRHSLDADHVVAVSTIATRTKNIFKAGLTGVFWGIGHTITILLMGTIVLLSEFTISESLDGYFEWLVAAALIYLGLRTFFDAKKEQAATSEVSLNSFHLRSLIVGMIHGLAGSAALLLLMVSQIQDKSQGFLFLMLFGLGSIVGMFVIAMLLSIPIRAAKSSKIQQGILYIVGSISVLFGIALIFFL